MELSLRKRHRRVRGDAISPPQEEPTSSPGRVTPGFDPDTSGVSALPETGTEETQGVEAGPTEGVTVVLVAGVSSKPTSGEEGGGGDTTLGSKRKSTIPTSTRQEKLSCEGMKQKRPIWK